MALTDGYNDSLQRILVDGDVELNAEFWAEVKKTAPGTRRYFADFVSPANNLKLIETAFLLYPDAEHITVSIAVDSIITLLAAGELVPIHQPAPPAPIAPPAPVDKNGRLLSQSQISFGEYTRFSNEHSFKDVRARAATDPGYAAFVTSQRRREMEGVGDDLTEYNPHITASHSTTQADVNVAASHNFSPNPEVRERLAQLS